MKARTNLDLAREKTGDVAIRAPIAGTVIEKTVEQGQIVASASANVSGGSTLVKMADLAMMQVRALVDETDIGRVQPGQPVEVTVEAHPGRTFRGRSPRSSRRRSSTRTSPCSRCWCGSRTRSGS